MINNKFNLILRPSRYFFTLISGLHLVLIFLICLADLDWIKFTVMLFLSAISYCYLIRKYIYRKNKFIVKHLWQDDNINNLSKWKLKLNSNIVHSVDLIHNAYVSNYLIILYFSIKDLDKSNNTSNLLNILNFYKKKTVSVLIFPDMIDKKDYHRLKLFLTSIR